MTPPLEPARRPARLRAGDTVALVAPSGPVPPDLLDAALPVLHGWGVKVRVGAGVRRQPGAPAYLAASDEDRAAEFTEAWLDPEVRSVLAARGGYGAQRMVDLVDWSALSAVEPKVLAGSSDVTAVHRAVHTRLGLSTLFSPMPASVLFDEVAAEHLRRTLFEPEHTRVLRAREPDVLVSGCASGLLVGGNLSLLAAGIGTPEQGCARDGIVLLEDVTESVYRIDRMLTQLLRSGWFAGVRGIVLGSWAACGDPAEIRNLVAERLTPLGVPMLSGFGFGHVASSPTVPLGVTAALDTELATLTLDSPALG
ncbi:S66 peptidase family protein [Amycolatopsis jiangsuensis]|uniref:Muramoyltetrapeptide carboxypeptidase n=1 Tax=Amycolatopsis jiangsuensis TaxID=1181879 RepID=A0A840IMA5_9PSEU|nr:LD-carboxypeptidase [Amycolatopsis jiangsuensis]MBB4683521.1 muramoyltetrapeptide carboxypeptidase [Amycolatopsis jiangsuensis]